MLHVPDPPASNALCFVVDKIIVYEHLEPRFLRCASVNVLGAIVVLANMQLYFLSLIDGTGTALLCKWHSCHGVGEGALETRGQSRLLTDGWIAVEGMEDRATGHGPPTSLTCPKLTSASRQR